MIILNSLYNPNRRSEPSLRSLTRFHSRCLFRWVILHDPRPSLWITLPRWGPSPPYHWQSSFYPYGFIQLVPMEINLRRHKVYLLKPRPTSRLDGSSATVYTPLLLLTSMVICLCILDASTPITRRAPACWPKALKCLNFRGVEMVLRHFIFTLSHLIRFSSRYFIRFRH